MAIIHPTTLVPSKLELLGGWLPRQNWYRNRPGGPSLTRAGGFRLDDPAGEVGIEFMVVLDDDGDTCRAGGSPAPGAYLVPLTYRGSSLPDAQDALIGTAEHGVLGQRWIYDGTRDPVLLTALADLIAGRVQAQAQRVSDTPDPTVLTSPLAVPFGERLDFRFERRLVPGAAGNPDPGEVTVQWTRPDGTIVRSVVVATERVRA